MIQRNAISFLSRRLISFLMLWGLCVSISYGSHVVVFGPDDFIRETSEPFTEIRNFSILDPTREYKLRIDNGGLYSDLEQITESSLEEVSSAVLLLNGVEVVSQNDFNKTVKVIEKDITLLADNQLTVQLSSQPGSGISISIIRVDVVDITEPDNLSLFNSSPITVRGTTSSSTQSVTLNGLNTDFSNRAWEVIVPIDEGNNTLTAVGVDIDNTIGTDSIPGDTRYYAPLSNYRYPVRWFSNA